MTAEGLLCRQYTGWHRNMPGMRHGLDTIARNHPISMRERDVYYRYYATQALHHFGGPIWKLWNDKLKVALPAAEERRGRERGSWSGDSMRRLLSSTMSIQPTSTAMAIHPHLMR